MRYQSGEYVVYRNWNICKVEEVTNKCFDGESTVEYLELRPNDSNGIIYVPLLAEDLERVVYLGEGFLEFTLALKTYFQSEIFGHSASPP